MSDTLLAIYLGESYAELELRAKDSTSTKEPLFKKSFFLPQTSLKAILQQQIKPLIETGVNITSVYVVTKYLDRLKSFRLGGSVVQVLNHDQENNYVFQNSSKLSLAASSLIISIKDHFEASHLSSELERIKKINPEAKKVVISLKNMPIEKLQSIETFFKENMFTVFVNQFPDSMESLRRTLINAGAEGTKEEIVTEIKELAPNAEILFWVNSEFKKTFENIDLFFSADSFLNHTLLLNKKNILIHTDLERWIILKNKYCDVWNSPWGDIHYSHLQTHQLGIHPFSEVFINGSGHLSFSQQPAAIEPGPMLAGRSVKPLVVDAFYQVIAKNKNLNQMFSQLTQTPLCSKIDSQFKVLEKGQIHYEDPLTIDIVQDFIINKLGYDILLFKLKEESFEWTGHLNILFEKLNGHLTEFTWTDEIFKRATNV